jgi:hypothetical protein
MIWPRNSLARDGRNPHGGFAKVAAAVHKSGPSLFARKAWTAEPDNPGTRLRVVDEFSETNCIHDDDGVSSICLVRASLLIG